MKFIITLLTLSLINCNTLKPAIQEDVNEPSSNTGCSSITIVKDRLTCIGKLTKQLEEIRNAHITLEKEKIKREDEKYVKYKYKYCFTDKDDIKLICFDTYKTEYDPTTLGLMYDFGLKFGFGFVVGLATGIYIN